jgi:hypothetical protein
MKKLGKNLTKGDVVTLWPGVDTVPPYDVELLVLGLAYEQAGDYVPLRVIDLRGDKGPEVRLFNKGSQYGVRDFRLTPAQMHGDEVADMLHTLYQGRHKHVATDDPIWSDVAQLLDQVRPAPPTLDEVLRALVEQYESAGIYRTTNARDILARSRRAGVLK